MPVPGPRLALSVVVAADDACAALRECVSAYATQISHLHGEVLLVDAVPGAACAELAGEFPGVRGLRHPAGTCVPRLWQTGIEAARGEIVALTIGQCVPAADWAERVLDAHRQAWIAVGGAIEPHPRLRLRDWAVYFCRYSRYAARGEARFLEDLAGDNCSYKRAALEEYREAMGDGFWETLVHARMRANGAQLRWEPDIVVNYAGPLRGFVRRRFSDARYFAARRAAQMGVEQRLARALAFPLVFLLLIARIAARVWRAGRYRGRFLASLPLAAWYVMVWSVGEAAGYLFGAPSPAPQHDPARVSNQEDAWTRADDQG